MEIKKIKERVYQVQAENALLNATVIEYGHFLVLIDTLLLPKDIKALKKFLTTFEKPLRYLINTHWHSDHCSGNKILAEAETQVVAHELHLQTLKNEKHILNPQQNFDFDENRLLLPSLIIKEETDLLPDLTLLPTPGHTADGLSILLKPENIIIAGDTVLTGKPGFVGLPYFYWGNAKDLVSSYKLLVSLEPELIIPGHGYACNIPTLKKGLEYLQCLSDRVEDLFSLWGSLPLDELEGEAQKMIEAKDCYPLESGETFWVDKIHELNLKKLIREKKKDD